MLACRARSLHNSQMGFAANPSVPWHVVNVIRQKHNISRDISISSLFQSAWGTAVNAETLSQVVAPQLFAASLFPYMAFLWILYTGRERSGAPKMMIFGFCFLLVFVFGTIPAGIYAKKVYGTSLANVDWLHGTSEALLTITNLLIVMGLRRSIIEHNDQATKQSSAADAD